MCVKAGGFNKITENIRVLDIGPVLPVDGAREGSLRAPILASFSRYLLLACSSNPW